MKPVRVQRKRTKGWRMPPNTVYVGRPTKWGNPFSDVKRFGVDLCVAVFKNSCLGIFDGSLLKNETDYAVNYFYREHHKWLERLAEHPLEAIRRELQNKKLACWCPLDKPCHADVLLELANRKDTQ